MRGQFLKRMEAPLPENYQQLWDRRFELFKDGSWRSRKEFSDGRTFSTMWMHRATVLTPELQTAILRAQEWVYLAFPTHNPARGFAWTGVLEEEVSKTPQVAVLLPVYIGGHMLCSSGLLRSVCFLLHAPRSQTPASPPRPHL